MLALIGILSLGAGYVLAMTVQNPTDAILVFFIAVIAVIIGTYRTFIAGSVALLKLLRKNKNYYYQTGHFIATSSMIFRMKKHGAGLASICILSTMVLVMISSTACLYFGAGNAINAAYPRDLEATIGMRKTNDATFAAAGVDLDRLLAASLQKQGLKAKNEIRYTLCSLLRANRGRHTDAACGIYSGRLYLRGHDRGGIQREFWNPCKLGTQSGRSSKKNEGSLRETMLTIADKRYAVIGEAKKMILRGTDAVDMANAIYLVVSDRSEFDRVVQALRQSAAAESFRLVNCRALNLTEANGSAASETRISAAEEELQREVLKMQDKPDTAIGSYKGNQPVYASMDMNFRTKGSAMETFTNLYGGLFFPGDSFGRLAFLGATVMIMYYKQITEGYDDKERFHVLRDVGMSDREIRRSIRDQVRKVFFIPLLGAGLHIAFAFHIIKLMIKVFGISNTALLIYTTLASFLLFAAFYIVVYLITSRAYYKIVAVEQ